MENEIPTGIELVYASLQERKIYRAKIDFTKEELQEIKYHFNI